MSAGSPQSSLPDFGRAPAYLALLRHPQRRPLFDAEDRAKAGITAHWPELACVHEDAELLVMLRREKGSESAHSRWGAHHLIGAMYERNSSGADLVPLSFSAAQPAPPPAEAADRLLGTVWGRYVALLRHEGETWVLRDPSGQVPVYMVRGDGLLVVTSSVPYWLARAVNPGTSIDIRMLGQALAHPPLVTHRSLVRSVVTLPAGSIVRWAGALEVPRQIWSPARFARPSRDPMLSVPRLRAAVERSCRASAANREIVLELSGGLDSAIVLGGIASSGDRAGITAVNFATTHVAGDERMPARAAADMWKVRLIEAAAPAAECNLRSLLLDDQPIEPVLYGLDPIHERTMVGIASCLENGAILTGQGGDAVFFQMGNELVAIDYMRDRGWGALIADVVVDAAIRSRRSVWSVWSGMMADRLGLRKPVLERFDQCLLHDDVRASLEVDAMRHPWLEGAGDLPPAKRAQLAAIANCQLFAGPNRRGLVAPVLHPLMAQPVMEAALALPTYLLSSGTGDRALARTLFSDWLPPAIRNRRGKGETSDYYSRTVVQNLPFLRPFLLDGRLVAHRLLDRSRLEALLDEDALIWSDEGRLPIIYASFEAWVRSWER